MNTELLIECWNQFQREHPVSVDCMLCDPTMRAEFLSATQTLFPESTEQQIFWKLLNLRKKKILRKKEKSVGE